MLGIRLYEIRHSDGDVMTEHHHDIHQILYALDGFGQVTLDGASSDFERGSGVVIVPHCPHSIVSAANLTVLVLEFDEQLLEQEVRHRLLHKEFAGSRLVKLHGFGDNELRQLTRKMLFEQTRSALLHKLAIGTCLAELLLLLARCQPVSGMNGMRAEKLRDYIDTHYYTIANPGDLSARLGVSARHLNNIFKERYHMTPLQYVTEVRMRLAKQLLAETDKDIASICFELGFETLSTFYRTFKGALQMTPNGYRKLYRTGCATPNPKEELIHGNDC